MQGSYSGCYHLDVPIASGTALCGFTRLRIYDASGRVFIWVFTCSEYPQANQILDWDIYRSVSRGRTRHAETKRPSIQNQLITASEACVENSIAKYLILQIPEHANLDWYCVASVAVDEKFTTFGNYEFIRAIITI